MLRTICLLLLGTFMIGCAHARGSINIGSEGEDGEVRNGFEANYLSRDPEKMVMAASKATVHVMNAETCRIAVENGRPCMMEGFSSGPFFGQGMLFNNGYGAPQGLGSNVAGRLFHGNAFGGAVTPQYVPVVPVQAQAPAQNDTALREELANVRRLAERADKKGDAAIDATKKVVTHLSGTPATKPATTVPPPSQAPATGTGAANLPPP